MEEKKEISEHEKYYAVRANYTSIYQDAYRNKVYINEKERSVIIEVDDIYEYYTNDDWLPQGSNEENSDEEYDEEESEKSDFDFTDQDIADSNNDYLYHDVFHLSLKYSKNLHEYKINPFASLMVTYPVGEGLLEFCFSDFTEEIKSLVGYGMLMKALGRGKVDDDKVKNYSHEERFDFMTDTFMFADDLMKKTVYTSVLPI